MSDYPWVHAASDYGIAKGPRAGITWHMAEGGGTVGYLSRPNPNNVSVHFVVERSGRVVQMLDLIHANGSINPTLVRKDDDRPYVWQGVRITYGRTAAKTVLGRWADDPNSATIGVEVEGYAKDGPNLAQMTAMERLYADMARRFDDIRSLAHRDFANYKACPGKLIPWDRLGGHGPALPGDTVKSFPVYEAPTLARVRDLAWLYDDSSLSPSDRNVRITPARDLVYVGTFSAGVRIVAYEPTGEDANISSRAMFVRASDLTDIRPAPASDCASAIAADRAKAHVCWED